MSLNGPLEVHCPLAPSMPRPIMPTAAAYFFAARTAALSKEIDAPVIIMGAGPAGLAAALALHQAGIPSLVLERAAELPQQGSAFGLWHNAWGALDALGVGEQLRGSCPLTPRRVRVATRDGRVLQEFGFGACDADARAAPRGVEFRGVRRGALLQCFVSQLPPGTIRYGQTVTAVDDDAAAGGVSVTLADGRRLRCRVLVGADGARSVAARHLGLPPPGYQGYIAFRGVATYAPGEMPISEDVLCQIWGAGVRSGCYAITPTEMYWFATINAPEGQSAQPPTPERTRAEATAALAGWGWGMDGAVAATPPELLSRSRIVDRWLPPRAFGRGCVTLVGDAAHPMTPNLGQGAAAALEDSVVLARTLQAAAAAAAGGGGGGGGSPGGASGAAAAPLDGLSDAQLARALRAYEAARAPRALRLTVQSWVYGAVLQLPYAPAVAARDLFVERAFSPAHFLDHTEWDSDGEVAAAVAAALG